MPFTYTGSQQNAGGLVVHNNTFDATPGTANSAQFFGAGGDWVKEATDTNHAATVATNWFTTYEYFANSNYDFVSYDYNTATHAATEISTTGYSSLGTAISGAGQQLKGAQWCFGIRAQASSYMSYCHLGEWNTSLNGIQHQSTRYNEVEYYNGGYRLSDTVGFNFAASNGGREGFIMHTYTSGTNYVTSAKGAPGAQSGPANGYDLSSPGGGTRDSNAPSNYANLGDYRDITFLGNGGGTGAYFLEGTTRIDISHLAFDGTSGSTPTLTDNDNAITLPSHSGSTQAPNYFATTWGNILLHHDTATPTNARVYPVTWSGGTASVGTHKSWVGGDEIKSHEVFFAGIDGIGNLPDGHGYKYMCGQDRGTQRPDDFYRTVRMRDIGSDMALDFLVIDFSNSDGTHSITILHKDARIYSSSDSAHIQPIYMANNKDVLIWHKDTNNLDYFIDEKKGFFFNEGELKDETNTLTSNNGIFYGNKDLSIFYVDVELLGEDYKLNADSMTYNSITKEAITYGYTEILSDDSLYIESLGGSFTQDSNNSSLNSSKIESDEYILEADFINFDEINSIYFAQNKVKLKIKKTDYYVLGDEGIYDRENNITKIYGNALLRKNIAQDTFYLSSDTILALDSKNEMNKLFAYNNVKFYKNNFIGKTDSVVFFIKDSLLEMYNDPIIWNNNNQISSDTIQFKLIDDKVDQMNLIRNSFIISQDTLGNFNQIKGRNMKADFYDNDFLKSIEVSALQKFKVPL